MHKSEEILQKEIEQYSKSIKIGGVYSHYKNQKNHYEVLHLAINEADDEVYVIYKALYGEQLIFSRSADVWLEKVEVNGRTLNRFSLVE